MDVTMKTISNNLYNYIILPLFFPVFYYCMEQNSSISTLDKSPALLQVVFTLSVMDIIKYKLNRFDQMYLLIATSIAFLARFNLHQPLGPMLQVTDSLLILYLIFRSFKFCLSFFKISLLNESGSYKLIVIFFLTIGAIILFMGSTSRNSCHTRVYSNRHACAVNLKTLTAGVEMYELDTNLPFEINDLDSFDVLVDEKYIQGLYMCPDNLQSKTPYHKLVSPSEICCETHGCVDDIINNKN